MARSMDAATQAALVQQNLYLVWFIRLDIQTTPLYTHTGIGDMTFVSGAGYDPEIVGFDFIGSGNILSIDAVTDTNNGSQAVNISLPGVDITLPELYPIVNQGYLWQRQKAYIWVATFDINGNLVGKPIRIKTGRMDQMTIVIDPDNNTGTLTCSIESQQSYNSVALQTRYADQQSQIDSTDTSNIYVADLANKTPEIGNLTSNASSQSTAPKIMPSSFQGIASGFLL